MRETQCGVVSVVCVVLYVATSVLNSAVWNYVVCVCAVGSGEFQICGIPLMQSGQPMQSFLCGGCDQLTQSMQSLRVCVALPMNSVQVLAVVLPTSGSVGNIISMIYVGIPTIPRCFIRDLLTVKCLGLSGPVMAFDVICREFGNPIFRTGMSSLRSFLIGLRQ